MRLFVSRENCPTARFFFYKHQVYKHLEPQNWPKNKHILCTTPSLAFVIVAYELLCYELLCYELSCALQTYKLMNWIESQNIVFLAILPRRKGSNKGVSGDEKGREG